MINKNNLSVTNIIIIACVAIYVLMYLTGANIVILRYGLNSPFTNRFVTYITSAFLHGGALHLFMNMYFLFIVGNVLESGLGKTKYLIYFFGVAFVTGFITSLFSTAITIGASGVLYGMMATIMSLDYLGVRMFRVNINALLPTLILNLVLTFIIPGISIVGHLSGLLVGILAAYIIAYTRKR